MLQSPEPAAPAPSPAGDISLRNGGFSDADEHARALRNWNQRYDQLTAGRFSGWVEEVCFDTLQVFRERTNQSVYQAGQAWPGSQTIGVPIELDNLGWYCGEAVDRDSLITLNDRSQLDFRSPRTFDLIAVTTDAAEFRRYAQTVEGRDIERELRHARIVPSTPQQVAELRNFLLTVLDSIRATPGMLQHAAMRRGLEQAVHGSLLAAMGIPEPPKTLSTSQSRRAVVDRAREYMRAHINEPITVADLCEVLKVSRRTLQYSFQEVLDLNPVSFLRALRLNAVRRTLRQADPERDSVSDIAAHWGFWHLSHFAADYKVMFGELPSETLRTVASPDRPPR